MCVQPDQMVRTAWVDIDVCRLGFRLPMSPEGVEKKCCRSRTRAGQGHLCFGEHQRLAQRFHDVIGGVIDTAPRGPEPTAADTYA
jgi:hypothetical protein